MDLDEMLRVNRRRDMDELINFWAGTGLLFIINDSIYPAVSKASRTGNKVSCQPNDCPNRW